MICTPHSYFQDYIKARYLPWKAETVSETQLRNLSNQFYSGVFPFIGFLELEELEPYNIKTYKKTLLRIGYSLRRTQDLLDLTRLSLRRAVADNLISANPCEGARRMHMSSQPNYIQEEELELVLQAIIMNPLHNFFLFLMATGLKEIELIPAEYSKFDTSHMKLTVPTARTSPFKERTIPLSSFAQEILLDQMRMKDPDCDLIFPGPDHKQLTMTAIQKETKRIQQSSQITAFTPSALRTTFALIQIKRGASLRSIQDLMGYAKPNSIVHLWHISSLTT